jgi:hypothetical protein
VLPSSVVLSALVPPCLSADVMHPDEVLYPALFHEGHAYFLERSDARTASYFGGPFEGSMTGIEHGPRPLHHIATLNGDCFEPLWHVVGGGSLRLLYGMCYSGCRLKYRNSANAVDLLEIKPTASTSDWPYPEYPSYLPYFPLRLQRRSKCNVQKFLEASCQPIEVSSSEVLVLVPASPLLGISLWGPSGDAEGTQIVFRCDLAKRTVEAYNQCN